MDILEFSPRKLPLLDLSVDDVATYATHQGWRPISHPNKRFRVFEGPLDDAGEPIHLVLTSHNNFGDAPLRVAEAAYLLAAIEDRSLEEVVADIKELTSQVRTDNEPSCQEFEVLLQQAKAKTNNFFELAQLLGRDPLKDFAKADLSHINLSKVNLNRANLTRTNFSGADLTHTNLSGADLSRANLTGANLTGANLTGANLTGANLTGANLTGANLSRAKVDQAHFGQGKGLPEAEKLTLKERGAIFYTDEILDQSIEASQNFLTQNPKNLITKEDKYVSSPSLRQAGLDETPRPAIVANGVEMEFQFGTQTLQVLKGIDLTVLSGDIELLMGPSGSGKTTLLSILGGILTPTAGQVYLLGQEITGLSRNKLNQFRLENIGFIFEGFNLFPTLTIAENVETALNLKGIRGRTAKQQSLKLLEQVGLADKAKNLPGDLSRGQKQRVAIARALAGNPRIIFADEPTAALDSQKGRAIIELLRALAKEEGATVVMVTHDPRIMDVADCVVYVEDGQISTHSPHRTLTPFIAKNWMKRF